VDVLLRQEQGFRKTELVTPPHFPHFLRVGKGALFAVIEGKEHVVAVVRIIGVFVPLALDNESPAGFEHLRDIIDTEEMHAGTAPAGMTQRNALLSAAFERQREELLVTHSLS